ncbi:Transient receptor potential cation channel subfamily A member 1 [Diplonema papillatum]|nr:Transient receptor potential cation channel subfamily A member 1 [Diplonema papillatum]
MSLDEYGALNHKTAQLKLFWNADRNDHMLTATAAGETDAAVNNYQLIRTVGMVFAEQVPNTTQIVQMWSEKHQDHALLMVKQQGFAPEGYTEVRVEGYVYEFKQSRTGGLPLTTYWSEDRKDTIGVADSGTATDIMKAGCYVLRRIEARILPYSGRTKQSPRGGSGSPRSYEGYAPADSVASPHFYSPRDTAHNMSPHSSPARNGHKEAHRDVSPTKTKATPFTKKPSAGDPPSSGRHDLDSSGHNGQSHQMSDGRHSTDAASAGKTPANSPSSTRAHNGKNPSWPAFAYNGTSMLSTAGEAHSPVKEFRSKDSSLVGAESTVPAPEKKPVQGPGTRHGTADRSGSPASNRPPTGRKELASAPGGGGPGGGNSTADSLGESQQSDAGSRGSAPGLPADVLSRGDHSATAKQASNGGEAQAVPSNKNLAFLEGDLTIKRSVSIVSSEGLAQSQREAGARQHTQHAQHNTGSSSSVIQFDSSPRSEVYFDSDMIHEQHLDVSVPRRVSSSKRLSQLDDADPAWQHTLDTSRRTVDKRLMRRNSSRFEQLNSTSASFVLDPERYRFDKMSKEELETLTQATVNIQRIFRGHKARRSFKSLKISAWDTVLDKAMDNERTTRWMKQFESIIAGLGEALLAMGTDPEDISHLRQQAIQVQTKYQSKIDETLDKREEARQRLAKMKSMVSADEGTTPGRRWYEVTFFKVLNVVKRNALSLIGLLHDRDIDDQLDSQQTAWQTEPVFKSIVEGDFEGLKTVVSNDPKKLQQRDHFGATPLLVCCLLNFPVHVRMAKWLLRTNQLLARDVYTTDFYRGETPLHFTIIHRDVEMTKLVLDAFPEGVLARATGTFFQDRLTGCYFGESPLMFAISTNQPDLVLYLLEFAKRKLGKAKHEILDIRDSDANTVLHLCVWHNLPKMYEFIEMLCKEKPQPSFYECGLTSCYNVDGNTPFTLAAERGHMEMFSYLLEANTQVTWKYGPYSWRAVFIDEIEPSANIDRPSILQLLVDNEHKELLALPLIRNFLKQKWSTHVKKIFLKRILMVGVFVVAFTIAGFKDKGVGSTMCASAWKDITNSLWSAIYQAFQAVQGAATTTAAEEAASPPITALLLEYMNCEFKASCSSVWSFVESACGVFVFIGAWWKGTRELNEFRQEGFHGYFGVKGSMLLENILSSCFTFTMGLYYIARLLGSDLEDLCGAFAALMLWAYVLWLMLGFKQTGPFIIMIWKMLSTDMLQFLVIFITFQLGFTQAFHLVLNTDTEGTGYGDVYFRHLKACFEVLLGQVDLNISADTSYPLVAYFVMVSYVILVTILLLNLLIAMMSTTFSTIQDEADVIWNLEFSRMNLSLESELSHKERQKLKWWTIVEGRRCFMLPMLTEEGKKEYWDYEPDWDSISAFPNRPNEWDLIHQPKQRPNLTPKTRNLDDTVPHLPRDSSRLDLNNTRRGRDLW